MNNTPSPPGGRPTVLIGNIEPILRTLVRAALDKDADVVEVAPREDALERIRSERPDLVLLDTMMPRQSGSDVLAAMRRTADSADTPVIMLTAQAQFAREMNGSDATHYLLKPFSPLGLAALVGELLPGSGRPAAGPAAEEGNAALVLILERRADINQALLDASADGIRLVDLEGRTLLANAVIERLATEVFDVPANPTARQRSRIADRLSDPGSYLATLATIARDPECSTEDELELVEERRSFTRHTAPVHDSAGALIGRLIVVREVTAEREAARLKSEISGEREASRLKSELVATVSHELRTPLAGVLGFTELLMHQDVDEATSKRYLATIHGEAQRLTDLVDDFLDLHRIEAGEFKLVHESFMLDELVRRQMDIFSAQSAAHTLELTAPDAPIALVADAKRIGQVIANLLSNAIKYSPAGGAVKIAVTLTDRAVRVGITDTGLGIPEAEQARVFTKFFRADSSAARGIGGTGLGLALCHDIVTAHGGEMGFASMEGAGSTFWFELPVVPRPATEAEDDLDRRRLEGPANGRRPRAKRRPAGAPAGRKPALGGLPSSPTRRAHDKELPGQNTSGRGRPCAGPRPRAGRPPCPRARGAR